MDKQTIAQITGARVAGTNDVDIRWLLTDSRSLSFPEQTLFFALNTGHRDGAVYIPELYEKGVRAFVVSKDADCVDNPAMKDAVFFVVDDTLRALQQIAAWRRKQYDIPVIGITGSNGKTIVKEWLYQLLHSDYIITRSPRSYNSQIGVPLSVWQLDDTSTLGVFEAGISQVGEMERLQSVIQPTIGILTNLGDAHKENFETIEQKCREKLKLFVSSQVLIYPKDNSHIEQCVRESGLEQTLSWGFSPDADIQILSADNNLIKYKYKKTVSSFPFKYAFVDDACSCLALMLYLGYSDAMIPERMSMLEPIAMRLEVKQGHAGNLIINDSYNTDLTSLRIALDMLDQQADAKHLGKTVVLSDIPQHGSDHQTLYATVSALLKARHIDHIVTIGQNIGSYLEGDNIIHYRTTNEFIASSQIKNIANQAILLKGARIFRFERISTILEKRLHETMLEVNLSALVANLNHFRSLLRPETKIVSMVKANAYGTGAVEVAKTLQHHKADYLAVAVADEGVELRNEGIHLPIIVMDPEEVAMDAIIAYNLEPNIYNFTTLHHFMRAVERSGLTDYPVHIKIDSGMHRLGFEWEDMEQLIQCVKTGKSDDGLFCFQPSLLKIRSVFSHLAGSDDPKFDDFTLEQINRFCRCADKIATSFDYKILKHILNSAGIERFTQYQFDMVRLGISHYGFSSLPDVRLNNVCTLRTIILQVKTVHAGESVGYSRKTFLADDRQIAVIPIGYADGFNRHLSNGVGEVIVRGCRCKVVGNICMDQAMIDVTGIGAQQGDEVIIFGDELPIEEMAAKLNTITYEILTSVSPRVTRVYFQE